MYPQQENPEAYDAMENTVQIEHHGVYGSTREPWCVVQQENHGVCGSTRETWGVWFNKRTMECGSTREPWGVWFNNRTMGLMVQMKHIQWTAVLK